MELNLSYADLLKWQTCSSDCDGHAVRGLLAVFGIRLLAADMNNQLRCPGRDRGPLMVLRHFVFTSEPKPAAAELCRSMDATG